MGVFDALTNNLPEIKPPTQKKLSFSEKLKWTAIILILYFLLGLIPVYGLGDAALEQFKFLSIVLGASFGSIITLGIGPIVTGSIVLQLLNGSGLVKFDLTTHEGKKRFTGVQKLLSVAFVVIESIIFVLAGGLPPAAGVSPWILIAQLIIGGLLIMMMDEIVQKYGFGSGISLFIAAGVAHQIFFGLFSFIVPEGTTAPPGAIPAIITLLATGGSDMLEVGRQMAKIIATIGIFFAVVYLQAMKVEIPLSFGRVSGHGIRWPLNFLYTSNIPVILTAALLANFQLLGNLFPGMKGISEWIIAPNILEAIIFNNITWLLVAKALVFIIIYAVGALIFSMFWIQTSGMDAASQAKQMINSGLQIPGFRRDPRVLELRLNRIIWPLTIMGGLTIGMVAAVADLTGAIGTGTGLLLSVMIIYRLYEDIAKQHLYEMNPMMKKFMTL